MIIEYIDLISSKDNLSLSGNTTEEGLTEGLILKSFSFFDSQEDNIFNLEFLLDQVLVILQELDFIEGESGFKNFLSRDFEFLGDEGSELQRFTEEILISELFLEDSFPGILNLVTFELFVQNLQDQLLVLGVFRSINDGGLGEGNFLSTLLGLSGFLEGKTEISQEVLQAVVSTEGDVINSGSIDFGQRSLSKSRSILRSILDKRKEVDNPSHLCEMRNDGVHEDQLELDPSEDEILTRASSTAVNEIFFLDGTEFMETVFGNISETHIFIRLNTVDVKSLDLVFEDLIEEGNVFTGAVSSTGSMSKSVFLQPHFQGRDLQNGVISNRLFEVSIILSVTSFRQSETASISTIHTNDILQSEEITLLLGHLFTINQHITVNEERTRPHVRFILPNGSVIEETHGQVILNQILSGSSQVKRIPISEGFSELVNLLFRNLDLIGVGSVQEDVVPEFSVHLFRGNVQLASLRTNDIALEQMNDSVVSHIDGGIGKRFDKVILIEGKRTTETEGTRTTPLLQPFNGGSETLVNDVIVAIEDIVDVFSDRLLPVFIIVSKIPLIHQGNNTFVTRSGDNLAFRFPILGGFTGGKQVNSYQVLGFLDLLASIFTNLHDTIIETLGVAFILSILEVFLIILRLDLELIASNNSGQITQFRNVNDGNGVKGENMLVLNTVLLSKRSLVLQVSESSIIIRRIRRNGGNNTSTLIHRDSKHGKSVHLFESSKRSLQGNTDQIRTHNVEDLNVLSVFFGQVLEGHVLSGSFSNNENFIIDGFESTILTSGEDETVSLTVHSFRSQGSSSQVDVSTFKRLQGTVEFEDLQLNKSVFLRTDTFRFSSSIMISTDLVVSDGVNGRSLTELDVISFLQEGELPLDERVVVRVDISGDERSSVVDSDTERLQISGGEGMEVTAPEFSVLELGNIFFGDTHLLEDVPLSLFTLFFRELRRQTEILDFSGKFGSGSRNGLASTMETEREKNIETIKTLVTSNEIDFGHGVTVSQMQSTVQVRVRESNEVLLLTRVRVRFVGLFSFPLLLSLLFKINQTISSGEVLLRLVFHFLII